MSTIPCHISGGPQTPEELLDLDSVESPSESRRRREEDAREDCERMTADQLFDMFDPGDVLAVLASKNPAAASAFMDCGRAMVVPWKLARIREEYDHR